MSLTTKALLALLSVGLCVQISLVFWPIGNYATLVYLLFYLPLLVLLCLNSKLFSQLQKSSDSFLLHSLLLLLIWVTATCLWTNSNENLEPLLKTLKNNILIFLYITGIALLTKYRPGYLIACLTLSILIAGVIASTSIFDQYYLRNYPLTFRLTSFELKDRISSFNSVSAGIYFGSLALYAGIFLIRTDFRKQKIVFFTLLASLASCAITTYLTGTRTALLALTLTFIFLLILNKKWMPAFSIIIAVSIFITYGLWGDSEYLNYLLTRGGFGSWRPQIWMASIHASIDNLWLGSGMWHDTSLLAVRGDETKSVPHSHNHYLQILIWTGVAGLTIFIITLARAMQISITKHQNSLSLVASLGLIYFILVQFFDVYTTFTKPSYYWPSIWLPIGIALGLPPRIKCT